MKKSIARTSIQLSRKINLLTILVFCSVFFLWLSPALSGNLNEALRSDPLGSVLSEDTHLKKSLYVPAGMKKPLGKHKEDELLVKFKSHTSESKTQTLHKKHGAERIKEFRALNIHHVKLPRGLSVEEAIRQYRKNSDVEYAEPNYRLKVQSIPNDPLFHQLWGLNNTEWEADIDAPEAWDITTGSRGVVVAVIDTGVDYSHQDLAANIWVNSGELPGNGIDDDANGYIDDMHGIDTVNDDGDPFDDHGHGTHVSGTIGAVGGNGTGVVGVNWNIAIMACKFLDSGGYGYTDGAAACLNYIKMMKDRGVNVVATNNSWGCDGDGCYSQTLYDAINAQRDILFIAAAGNASLNLDQAESYPAKYDLPNLIAVAATDATDELAYFSSYGKQFVHVGAPGVDILSTLPAANIWNMTGGYGYLSGTSMATPHVAGLAGLLKAENPARDWRAIRNLILSGSESIEVLLEKTIVGGRINAADSLTCESRPMLPLLAIQKYPRVINVGTPVTLSAISILCGAPNGPVSVTLSGGELINLLDNGIAPDLAAGDGVFSGTWVPARAADRLSFSAPDIGLVISVPALKVVSYLPEANTGTSYHHFLEASSGLAPYTWSILSGTLPTGLTLSSAGEISGNPTTLGTFSFTIRVTDALASTLDKPLTIKAVDDFIAEVWAKTYDAGDHDFARDIAVDALGNKYVTGSFINVSTGNSDTITIKYGPAGGVLWMRTYSTALSDTGDGIAVDENGNVYVTGSSLNSLYYIGDWFTIKYDSSGNVVWTRTFDSGYEDLARDIAVDGNGYVYVTGNTESGPAWEDSPEMLTIKYDAAGNMVWQRVYGSGTSNGAGNPDYAFGIAVDASGNVHIAGHSAQWVPDSYNPGWLAAFYDYMTIKYDPAGNLLWATPFDTGGRFDFTRGIAVDTNGNSYVTGYKEDGFVCYTNKYDPSGNLQWSKIYDAINYDKCQAIAMDAENNIYVTGHFGNDVIGHDLFTVKYDSSGDEQWVKTSGGPSNDQASGIAVSASGDIYVSGYTDNGFNYDFLAVQYRMVGDPLRITAVSLRPGITGIPYSETVSVSGGTPPYAWTVPAGSLPTGLTLDSTTGVLSGTPSASGYANFTVQVTDAVSTSVAKSYSLPIYEPLVITTEVFPSGPAGQPYSHTLIASGGNVPYFWTIIAGALPQGLTLDPVTGTISGTPTSTGVFIFTARVRDWNSTVVDKQLSITITINVEPLAITMTSLPSGQTGEYYSSALIATGGILPYTWSITSGALPAGITLNASTGELSGTPVSEGTFSFTVQVMDINSSMDDRAFSLLIAGSGTPGQLTWMSKAPMPVPQSRWASAAVNGKIYILGGFGADQYVYDPHADSWQSRPPLSEAKYVPAEAAQGDIVYIVGGQGTSVLAYDTNTGSSPSIGNLATERFMTSAAILNDKLYVVGGRGDSVLGSIDEFDLVTRTAIVKTTMPAPRELAAVITVGQKIYIMGGADASGNPTNTCWEYDPAANTFTSKNPMPYGHTGNAVETVNGKIYVINGATSAGFPPDTWTTNVLEYDPVLDIWQVIGQFPTSRYALMTGIVNNTLYVIGGDNGLAEVAVNEAAVLPGSAGTATPWALGYNVFGQLGNGTNTDSALPVPVIGLTTVNDIAAGSDSSMALLADGTVWTWGLNQTGGLGDGTYIDKNTPVPVIGMNSVRLVAPGWAHSLGVKTDGTIWRWGSYSESGFGSRPEIISLDSNMPVQVTGVPGTPALPPLGIGGGAFHSLVINFDGTVWTWGANDSGQLGNGTLILSTFPVQVIGLDNIVSVCGGYFHSAALRVDGTIWTWGSNMFSQLGNGTNIGYSSVPVQVSGIDDAVGIACGGFHTLSIRTGGAVWGWGLNSDGELGTGEFGDSNVPVPAVGVNNVTAISAGLFRSLALQSDGTVWKWGSSYPENSNVPIQASGLSNVSTIAAGTDHTLVLMGPSYEPLSIVTSSLPQGFVSTPYEQTIVAINGSLPYTWSLIAGSLPDGLSLNSSNGLISGIPIAAGTYSFTVQVSDASSQTATREFSISSYDRLILITTSLSAGTANEAYSQTFIASGGKTPYDWSVAYGSLPNGLTLDGATGVVSGIPATAGSYSFTLQVADSSSQTAMRNYSITIYNALTITTESLPAAGVNAAYSRTLAASGGQTPYTWSVTAGGLPEGLTLNSTTGQISGTPLTEGVFTVTVQVTDAALRAAAKDFSITVYRQLLITTPSLAGANLGMPYSQTVAATGGKLPYIWSRVSGSLPGNLTLDSSTGEISGTPGTIGTYYFTVQVRDENSITATKALSITVVDIRPDLEISLVTVPGTGGAGMSITVTDTMKNDGGVEAGASITQYYLSPDRTLDSGDTLLGARSIGALAAGATNQGSQSIAIPLETAAGTYYIIAKADGGEVIVEISEYNNTRASSAILIGPDLTVSVLAVPGTAGAGTNVTITDTIKNTGGGDAGASITSYYLSPDSTLDPGDSSLGSRSLGTVAAGATNQGSETVAIPAGTPSGSYYVIAKTDGSEVIAETSETNNTKISSAIKIGPDLTITAITVPAIAGAGSTITVTETTKNDGPSAADASTTRLYLSTNTAYDDTDPVLGSRTVPALGIGESSTATTSVTIAAGTPTGSYYVIARADGHDVLFETSEYNNTRASSATKIGPDLSVTALTAPAGSGAGLSITITDDIKNNGGGDAGASSTRYYLSPNSTLDSGDPLLGERSIGALAAGVTDQGTQAIEIPLETVTGIYYIIAKADGGEVLAETSETNNTRTSSTIRIGPDLTVSALTVPGTAGAGTSIAITDTVKNSGAGEAGASITSYYLSSDRTLDPEDSLLGSRLVGAVAAGATNQGSQTVTISAETQSGIYYVIAKADGAGTVPELIETNNTLYRTMTIGPDLTVTAISAPTAVGAGSTITVTDSTKNNGPGEAPSSTTRFYLSSNTTLDSGDVFAGSRAVEGIAAGATNQGNTSVTIPAGTPTGTYYLIAKADGDEAVFETSESNNTRLSSQIKIGPDLTVSAFTAAPSITGAGMSITVTDTTKNSGAGNSNASVTSYYLSVNTTLDAADIRLEGRLVGALEAQATDQGSISVTIPPGTPTGSYYILAKADGDGQIPETSEINNTRPSSVIRIGPDFTVSALTVPSTATVGANITVTDTTKNSGGGDAEASTTSFYLSTNSSYDADDRLVGSRPVVSLEAGATNQGSTSITIPTDLQTGSYYIIARADDGAAVVELYESNNTMYRSITINP